MKCFVPFWKFFHRYGRLPQSITLLIFSYLPYKFVQTTASLVCKAWRQLAYGKNLIKYAGRKVLSEINARDSSKETLDNFLQAVKWRPRMFHSIDLCGATTIWKTFGEIAHNCTELKILNMARTKSVILEYPLIQATNIVKLNLSETDKWPVVCFDIQKRSKVRHIECFEVL